MTQGSNYDRLEGVLMAHRKIIAMIVAQAGQSSPNLIDALRSRTITLDGQEDPGAVPAEGLAQELEIAEEMRRILSIVEATRPDP